MLMLLILLSMLSRQQRIRAAVSLILRTRTILIRLSSMKMLIPSFTNEVIPKVFGILGSGIPTKRKQYSDHLEQQTRLLL